MKPFTVEVPIRTYSPNVRTHPIRAAKRRRDERDSVHWAWIAARRPLVGPVVAAPPLPVVVTLTRLACNEMDRHDNLRWAMKGVVDEVAILVGLPITHLATAEHGPQANDGDPRVTWVYAQEKTKRGVYGVRITVEPRKEEP